MVDTTDEWITTRTGIRERHIADKDTATSDLAAAAVLRALEAAGLGVADIDLIVLGTATPDMLFPSTAALVQAKLGAAGAVAFDVSAACSGFIYAIAVARGLIETGPYRNAVVIGAETLTRIVDWDDRTTCVLFGDGAGAVVLGPTDDEREICSIELCTDGTLSHLLHMPAGGSRMPASEETVKKRLHCIHMEGREVFKHAVKFMTRAMNAALEQAGMSTDDLDLFIPHQANLRIMEAVSKRMKIPEEKVFINVDRYGNTSAASVPIALDEAVRAGRCPRGTTVGLVAFGGGFTSASAVVKL